MEEQHLLEAVRRFKLRYVVITSVTRDDLDDGGAAHFVKIIERLHAEPEKIQVEVLIPDFFGSVAALETLVNAEPEVVNHNMETSSRLYPTVRPKASYEGSLQLLKLVKDISPGRITKSGIMVGLGETQNEIYQTLKHLREVDCDLLTIGQYLAPSNKHHPIIEFISPEKFGELKIMAEEMGFLEVACAPLVRSSYRAFDMYLKAKSRMLGGKLN